MKFATPTDLWTLALPPLSLFQDGRLARGGWTSPAADVVNAGTGTVTLDPESNPRDTYSVKVEFLRTGELSTPGAVNLSPLPQVRVSLTNGTTWGVPQTPDAQGRVKVLDAPAPITLSCLPADDVTILTGGGFTLVLANATTGTAVTFGSSNAAVLVSATQADLAFEITQQTGLAKALSHTYDAELGAVVLLLGTDAAGTANTTAKAARAYLMNSGLPLSSTYGGTGLSVVQAAAQASLPYSSFVDGDLWTFTTTPSPDVVAALAVESDYTRGYLRDTYNDPLEAWGAALVGCVANLARWRLITRVGRSGEKDMEAYQPVQERQWLSDVADGTIQPTVTEPGDPRRFPLLVPPLDPLSMAAGTFPI